MSPTKLLSVLATLVLIAGAGAGLVATEQASEHLPDVDEAVTAVENAGTQADDAGDVEIEQLNGEGEFGDAPDALEDAATAIEDGLAEVETDNLQGEPLAGHAALLLRLIAEQMTDDGEVDGETVAETAQGFQDVAQGLADENQPTELPDEAETPDDTEVPDAGTDDVPEEGTESTADQASSEVPDTGTEEVPDEGTGSIPGS